MNYFKNNLTSWANEGEMTGLDLHMQEKFKRLSLGGGDVNPANLEVNKLRIDWHQNEFYNTCFDNEVNFK